MRICFFFLGGADNKNPNMWGVMAVLQLCCIPIHMTAGDFQNMGCRFGAAYTQDYYDIWGLYWGPRVVETPSVHFSVYVAWLLRGELPILFSQKG